MHVTETDTLTSMYMYDVLVEIGGRGKERGLKAGDKHEEGESTSLA